MLVFVIYNLLCITSIIYIYIYIYYTQNILLILSKLNNKIDNKNHLVLDDGI